MWHRSGNRDGMWTGISARCIGSTADDDHPEYGIGTHRSVDMAMQNVCIDAIHGINGRTPEDTMRNMGRIASPGMVKTEEVIVDIMKNK